MATLQVETEDVLCSPGFNPSYKKPACKDVLEVETLSLFYVTISSSEKIMLNDTGDAAQMALMDDEANNYNEHSTGIHNNRDDRFEARIFEFHDLQSGDHQLSHNYWLSESYIRKTM